MNKIVKLSIVRENGEMQCPFGLPITEACKHVGKLIDNMCSIESIEDDEDKELAVKTNNRIFIFEDQSDENKCKCKYANVILIIKK